MNFSTRPARLFAQLGPFLALVTAPTLLGARGCVPGGEPELVCSTEFAPVCGADGVTYGNACEAEAARVEVAFDGACDDPRVCTAEFAPVCGADGRTYSNGCVAESYGVAVLHDGECVSTCAAVLCDLWCEFGFAVDPETGCELCACNPPPPPARCASDVDCAEDQMCALPACLPACEPGSEGCGEPVAPPPGVCVPRPSVPSPCIADSDCDRSAWCDTSECLPSADPMVCGGVCREGSPATDGI
jgi:hypothetical protein